MQRKFGIRSKVPVSSERLLSSSSGHLSNEEVLLAQGHNEFQTLPLLIFCLIQCDALRPSQGSFCPSYDSRAAAISNLRIMSPSCLSRCIAPRLDLWFDNKSNNSEDSRFESVNMSMIDLRHAIDEHLSSSLGDAKSNGSAPFLLVDCPSFVGIFDCQQQIISESSTLVPSAIVQAAGDAQNSYRVAQTLFQPKELDSLFNASFLEDMMLEDSITNTLLTFKEWKRKVSEIVFEYVKD